MRICFVASEVAPLAKTGGLADVAGALPRHLHDQGHDIRVFMPFYSSIGTAALQMVPVEGAQNVELRLGAHLYRYSLLETQLPGSSVPLYLVHCPAVYDRPTIYTIGADEHLRFLVLQRAALDGCQRLKFSPHIVHCNDWHTALLPMLLKTLYAWDKRVSRDAHGHVDPQHRLPGLVRCIDHVRRRRQHLGPAGTARRAPAADSIGCAKACATPTQSRR